MLENCTICPRQCKVNRIQQYGSCGGKDFVRVARADLHMWEEPCISGENGSGTIFFSGCSLRCVFCQNHEISQTSFGQEIKDDDLADLFLKLYNMGAENINLVNPTHYTPNILRATDKVKHKLPIPILWNSGGYERAETIRNLKGYVDIFLPDFKYVTPEISKRYSGVSDYFDYASSAVKEMFEISGYPQFDKGGMLKKGVLIRHLVLPSNSDESKKVIDYLLRNYDKERLYISLMSQYFPTYKAKEYTEINRKLTTLEYMRVVEYAKEKGLVNGFYQDKKSASIEYVPNFTDKIL